MAEEYQISLLSERQDIVIMRVENGWVIRTQSGGYGGASTPLKVAQTVEALAAIVTEWAAADATKADAGKAW